MPVQYGGKACFDQPYNWEYEGGERVWRSTLFRNMYKPEKVLEAGCATGLLVKALVKMGIDAWGCDISEWAIENAEADIKDRLVVADISEDLPYEDGMFDLVCCIGTLEHIEMSKLDKVASEFARVTSRWVHIAIPFCLENENKPWGDPTHVTYMPVSWWISLFYKHNLLVDLRRSYQESQHPFHNVELALCKGEVPKW